MRETKTNTEVGNTAYVTGTRLTIHMTFKLGIMEAVNINITFVNNLFKKNIFTVVLL